MKAKNIYILIFVREESFYNLPPPKQVFFLITPKISKIKKNPKNKNILKFDFTYYDKVAKRLNHK